MGGRGASSGISKQGKKYGTEYRTLLTKGRVKYVTPTSGSANTPMETRSKGRIYATVNKRGDIKAISFYDRKNKRRRQIDVTGTPHTVDGKKILPHVHRGYNHNERGDRDLSRRERKLVDKILKAWDNNKK